MAANVQSGPSITISYLLRSRVGNFEIGFVMVAFSQYAIPRFLPIVVSLYFTLYQTLAMSTSLL